MDADVMKAREERTSIDVWLISVTNEDEDTTIYLTDYNADIVFDGDTYLAHEIGIDPPQQDSDGSLPTAEIHISNVSREFQTTLANNNFFRNGMATFLIFDTTNTGADYSEDIDSLEIHSHKTTDPAIRIRCGVNRKFVSRLTDKEYGEYNCGHEFKNCMCGYDGVDTTCTQTRQACRAKSNEANFGAEPGLKTGVLRLGI